MNKLASIEIIQSIQEHPNAHSIELAQVLGYTCIVPKDAFKVGEKIVFVSPDTILPDSEWAAPFKKYASKRIRAIKIRNVFSFGIVIKLNKVFTDFFIEDQFGDCENSIGNEISHLIGVTKYTALEPQELNAKGNLPFGIFKTDEERYQSLKSIPYGEMASISLKRDGQSSTFYCKKFNNEWQIGVCSRGLEIKLDCSNRFTQVNNKYKILEKLLAFCQKHDKSLALRGEVFGDGVQNFPTNEDAKQPLSWECFSVLNLDNLKYELKDSPFNFVAVCEELDLPHVPIVEKDIEITEELITKYSCMDKLNGKNFEGVVANTANTSFKVLSLNYDSQK